MATVRVRVIHECEPPNMIERIEVYPTRTFWNVLFNTGRKPRVIEKYKATRARWSCDCGSEWSWSALFTKSWMCLKRTDQWKEREV